MGRLVTLYNYVGIGLAAAFSVGKVLGLHDWEWKWAMLLLSL